MSVAWVEAEWPAVWRVLRAEERVVGELSARRRWAPAERRRASGRPMPPGPMITTTLRVGG